ncbi:MAG: hypothetical protein M3Y72_23805, partial [Acidobacteriota bacterium]|nr:hypothetical protein [Acidobacteriota bacterium]
DVRLVCGNAHLFAGLKSRLADFYRRQAPKLLHHLSELTTQRQASFGTVQKPIASKKLDLALRLQIDLRSLVFRETF